MTKFFDLLFAWPLWQKYDNLKEPWRLFLCLIIVLPPIYVLNGAVKLFGWTPSIFAYRIAATYCIYLAFSSGWKLFKIMGK